MKQKELDEELKVMFLHTLTQAQKFAIENRDIESLGSLAQLIGTCINWDKEQPPLTVGFQPKEKEDENE